MQIKLNGKPYVIDAPVSIAALAETLALKTSQVAVERNLEIVPRSAYGDTMLSEGDEVEIVRFIGGG